MEKYILALDQGTTSSRAILFDRRGKICSSSQKEFPQHFPREGWVEHNPKDIWSSQLTVAKEAMSELGTDGKDLAGIGITNQRETTIVWDRESGMPIHNAIVWQDRRTADYCRRLSENGFEEKIRNKTGLIIDSYFSAPKIKWILDNVPGAREKAEKGKLAFGTVDSWLVWNLTRGEIHITDKTNACRTMLFNINTASWDEELLELFDIPKSMLPQLRSSSEIIGNTNPTFFSSGVPIAGIAGDQQSALFGQLCLEPGMAKNTYGTGCFVLLNTGESLVIPESNLISTIAWDIDNKITYALEGSIFNAGTAVQWLRDQLGFFDESVEIEKLAASVVNNGGVYMVPAFTGLGAPYWDSYAKAIICGLTRGSNKGHIARATLESIAFQTWDVLEEMRKKSDVDFKELRVDGGASVNELLMQFQADILHIPVVRPSTTETTALGAAYLAGLSTGFWSGIEDLKKQWKIEKTFHPGMNIEDTDILKSSWKKAVEKARYMES